MTPQTQEGYARLPEDLLRDVLQGAESVVQNVTSILGPALEGRSRLRTALEGLDLIQTYQPVDVQTVSGIDGGFAVERTSAVDVALCVAVGVEGLSQETTFWEGTQYEWWTRVDKHDLEVERLARGVMVAQELRILHLAPHELRILDGSHLTPVIQLNSALTAFSKGLRAEAKRVWEKLATIDALGEMSKSKAILAMPKYDSSRSLTDRLEQATGEEIPGDDKYLMSLLLEPGEFLTPQQVPSQPWASLHFDARPGDEEIAEAFQGAITPLKERSLRFTYFKPHEFSPAFRIELKEGLQPEQLNALCSTLESQITGPFVREPYPQYLADIMAKSVGLALSALQTAVQLALSGLGRPEIAEMLIQSYRTEGV